MKFLRTEFEIEPYVQGDNFGYVLYTVEVYKTFWGNERRYREWLNWHNTRETARVQVEEMKAKRKKDYNKHIEAMNKLFTAGGSEIIR